MGIEADQALLVAIEMERLGTTLYESLASCTEPDTAKIARLLANEERRHAASFQRLRDQLPGEKRGPDLSESELSASARKLRNILLPTTDKVRQVALNGSFLEALDMAIEMEHQAVDFYSNVLAKADGDYASVVAEIVSEETRHRGTLEKLRASYSLAQPAASKKDQ